MPDHRGVEKRRGFQRVLLGEIGAHEQLAVLAQRLIGQEMALDLFKAIEEEVAGFLMPVAEFAEDVVQQDVDLGLGERRHPPENAFDPVFAGRLERSDDDPAVIGPDDDSRSPDIELKASIRVAVDGMDRRGMVAAFERQRRAVTVHAEKLRGSSREVASIEDEHDRNQGRAIAADSYHTATRQPPASLTILLSCRSKLTERQTGPRTVMITNRRRIGSYVTRWRRWSGSWSV